MVHKKTYPDLQTLVTNENVHATKQMSMKASNQFFLNVVP